MQFMEALEAGKIAELGMPDKVIRSHISNLFIFGERVFKVYKKEKFFFADMSDGEPRKKFFEEDFFWNNAAAPEISKHLWGAKKDGDTYILVPPSLGEDFAIEMQKINDSQTLTKLLTHGEFVPKHIGPFVDALMDVLKTLTKERREILSHLFDKGLHYIMKEDVGSLHTWMYGADPFVPKEYAAHLQQTLLRVVDEEPYFRNFPKGELSAAIDDNTDNLLLLNGKPSFIDIMPPMEIWKVVDVHCTMYRFIVDIEVLGGLELGKMARDSYKRYTPEPPPRARLVHEIRAAGIQWSYRYMLNQNDMAEKFGEYAKTKVKELETLLTNTH